MKTKKVTVSGSLMACKAMTLVEVLVVLTIFVITGSMLTGFMVDISKRVQWNVENVEITSEVRLVRATFQGDASQADMALLYDDFSNTSLSGPSDQRRVGATGNCLVLIDTDFDITQGANLYRKIVVYYEDSNAGTSVLKRAEIEFPTPLTNVVFGVDGDVSVEDFIRGKRSTLLADSYTITKQSTPVLGGNDFFKYERFNTYRLVSNILDITVKTAR